MKDENHPKHRHRWQRHVNELLNRGEYRLVSPTAVLRFQAELWRAVVDSNRASGAFARLSIGRIHEEQERLMRKSRMWAQWSIQLQQWIRDLNPPTI